MPTANGVKRIPLYDATAPVACTITEAEIPDRIALLERLRVDLHDLERTEHGMVLRFPRRPDIEADLGQFVVDEKRCCQFWGFEVGGGEDLTLRWDGPPAARDLLDQLASFFRGDGPAPDLAGLL